MSAALMRTLVSKTTRSIFIREQARQLLGGQSLNLRLGSKSLAGLEEGVNVSRADAVELRHGKDDGNVPILSLNHDGFALRVINQGAEPILGLSGRDFLHDAIIAHMA